MIDKAKIKNEIINSLREEGEIEKIIIFGSFNKTDHPNDLDLAIVQNSSEDYLTLSLKYRRLIRKVTKEISVDLFPIVSDNNNNFYKNEILAREVIYAK